MNEAEKILSSLSSKEGVIGTIAMTKDGVPIRTTFSDEDTNVYSALVAHFVQRTHKALSDMPEAGELETIRIRSQKNEIIIAPYGEFVFIAVQDPFYTKKEAKI